MTIEKRMFRRFVFSKENEIKATLVSIGGNNTLEARVLNVSKGGMGLALGKNEQEKLGEDLELLLESVTAGSGLPCLAGQTVKIKWILDYEPLANLGIGCEFVNMNKECIEAIEALFVKEPRR
jgi:c-di-GMP-binding flagellar brake protein YcgR